MIVEKNHENILLDFNVTHIGPMKIKSSIINLVPVMMNCVNMTRLWNSQTFDEILL